MKKTATKGTQRTKRSAAELAVMKLLIHAEKEGHAHSAAELAASVPFTLKEVQVALKRLASRGKAYAWKKHWRPIVKNPSPGERQHGPHASADQRIAAAKALKKARDFYDSDDLVTVPRELKGYKTPTAFVEIGDFVALEYDSDKFDGKPRIYRHEATRKRRFLMSVDGSTIIAHPPFKLTKRGIEG